MSKKTRKNSSSRRLAGGPAKTAGAKSRAAAKTKTARSAGKTTARPGTPAAKAGPKAPRQPASQPAGSGSAPTNSTSLSEGARAPAFRLPSDAGEHVSLADFRGRRLVLFFYPRADTPGCTREAIDFTRLASAFAENRTAVLGVSGDPPKAQQAFRDKHRLAVPLASEETHAMLEAYGAWGEKSMYGRTFLGIRRTTILIGEDGRIVRIWRNVKVDGHADEVLAAVRAL